MYGEESERGSKIAELAHTHTHTQGSRYESAVKPYLTFLLHFLLSLDWHKAISRL